LRQAVGDPPGRRIREGVRLLAKMQICDWADLDARCQSVVTGVRQGRRVAAPPVLLATPATAADQLTCARAYSAARFPAASPPVWEGTRYRHDKIKVAYISSDFREHPVSYLLAGLIERHDGRGLQPWPSLCEPTTTVKCAAA